MTLPLPEAAVLSRIAALAGGNPVEPGPVSVVPLAHRALNPVSAGLYRVAGDGWSVVLKAIRPAGTFGNDIPAHMDYWRREASAYASGLLDWPGGGWRAARCYLVEDRPDGLVWLWLEDLGEPCAWTPADYRQVARAFGNLAGCWLDPRLPEEPWLCRGFLRSWLAMASREGFLAPPPEGVAPSLEPVRELLAGGLAERLRAALAGSGRLLDALDAMPQTLCHHDCGRPNIFPAAGETVVIDFGYLGVGAVGEDLGTFLGHAVMSLDVEAARADSKLVELLHPYCGGVAEMGETVDERQIERAALTAAALRNLPFAGLVLKLLSQERPDAWVLEWFAGHGELEDVLERWSAAVEWLLTALERAGEPS